MDCQICFQRYNDKALKPISINCGHTFCKKCLNNIKSNNTAYNCPACRKAITNESVNYAILEILGLDLKSTLANSISKTEEAKNCLEVKSSIKYEEYSILLTSLKEGINAKKEAVIQAVLNNFNELMNEINQIDSQIKDLINIVDCESNFLELKNKLKKQSNPVQLDALNNEINNLKEKIDNYILNFDKLNFKVQFNQNDCGPILLGSIENIGDDFKNLKLKLESCVEATFQLEIDNFTKFSNSKGTRQSVNPCIVGHLPWRILANSKLNKNKENCLGFFLQCNTESESSQWSINAVAELRLINLDDSTKNAVQRIEHLFTPEEYDWGFLPFLNLTMKEIKDNGFYNQQKDSITLEVWLKAEAKN